jgi:hypothetical protein
MQKTTTSWQTKERYNKKAYRSINLKLKPATYDRIEGMREENDLSRPELIETLLTEKERRTALQNTKEALERRGKSKEGLWVNALNLNYAALLKALPLMPQKDPHQKIKVIIKENEAQVYVIRDDNLPALYIYDHPALVYFEVVGDAIRLTTLGRAAERKSCESDCKMSETEYLAWFFENTEMNKEEYERVVIREEHPDLPNIEYNVDV